MIHQRELNILNKLSTLKGAFLVHSEYTKVPIDLAMSIVFVELQQYELRNAMIALKVLKNKLCKIHSFNCIIGQWIKPVSVGLCHIKEFTAFRAIPFTNNYLTAEDINLMHCSEVHSIKVLYGILLAHRNRWQKDFDVYEDDAVWATLFNICDFGRIKPHDSPLPGGSEAPLFIDGILYDSLPFGKRVEMVIKSKSLESILFASDFTY